MIHIIMLRIRSVFCSDTALAENRRKGERSMTESIGRVCGIVCEFNPFHNGHMYLLERARSLGFDAVVCVMSGNFVQRGEAAIADKKARAEAAALCGADLVLSLPFPYSSSSAESFARAGVHILSSLGIVDSLLFGSECGEIEPLRRIADAVGATPKDGIIALQKEDRSRSFASLREQMIGEKLGENYAKLARLPNNNLGIEYLRAINALCPSMEGCTVKRVGIGHDGGFSGSFASGSALREKLLNGINAESTDVGDLADYMPAAALEKISGNIRRINDEKYFAFVCGSLLTRKPEELTDVCGVCGGFEHLLYDKLASSRSLGELYRSLASKNMTDARIRRTVLFASLGVTESRVKTLPRYSEVLAIGKEGRKLLASARKKASITLLSKPGNIRKADETAMAQFAFERKCEELFKKLLD